MIRIKHPRLSSIAQDHYLAIVSSLTGRSGRKTEEFWNNVIKEFFPFDTFHSILTASPERINDLVGVWNSQNPTSVELRKFKLFKTYYDYLGGRQKIKFALNNGCPYTTKTLIDNLGIKVCPYCNRNFIYNAGEKRSSEIDHFYPSSEYPFLAISFYNLIPSCKVCNHVKGQQAVPINPYSPSTTLDKLKFRAYPISIDFGWKDSGIEIVFDTSEMNTVESTEFDDFKRVFQLGDQYAGHKDIATEIVQKQMIYTSSYIDELVASHSILFDSREDILRILYGNYILEEDYWKRPLAKLTGDLYWDFELNH